MTYFTNEVERAIAAYFTGRINELKNAGVMLGSYSPVLEAEYDIAMQFDALPMIPIIVLYNDMDEEFSANCTMLFENKVERYLDIECIAMLGRQVYSHLKEASEAPNNHNA